MKVTIVGAGYVGLTTGVALAYLGHRVNMVDKNQKTIKMLQNGEISIYEYGLQILMKEARDKLSFNTSFNLSDKTTDAFLVTVGTPSKLNGDVDLVFVESAVREIAGQLKGRCYPLVVTKSTVPPGTARRVEKLINFLLSERGLEPGITVASNPEFLREGNALHDMLYPDRIIIGADSDKAYSVLKELYRPVIEQSFTPPRFLPRPTGYNGPTLMETDPISSELIKYASNAFLSMKISFINEFAGMAELLGADIMNVAQGIGLDKRIGDKYLQAGVGWGGSCFGKDARAITYTARKYGYSLPLVEAAIEVNARQRKSLVAKLQSELDTLPGSTIGILGLAFKPGTDDIRDTPATELILELLEMGAFIKVYDPIAIDNYKRQFPELNIKYARDVTDMARGCDAIVLLTEWDEFKEISWKEVLKEMNGRIFVDGRNALDPVEMSSSGFYYRGVGRLSIAKRA